MGHVQIDVPNLLVAFVDHDDFLGHLNEIDGARPAAENEVSRNARRPAARAGAERHFAGEHFFIVALHPRHHPGLQNGVGEIADSEGRLPHRVVANIRMGFVERDRPRARRWGKEFGVGEPAEIPSGQSGNAFLRARFCRRSARAKHTNRERAHGPENRRHAVAPHVQKSPIGLRYRN